MIIIKKTLPPIWPILKKVFPIDENKTFVSFGNIIYGFGEMTPDLYEHEKIHLERQKYSKLYAYWWWTKYLLSKRFRFQEELLAYKAQWHFCEKNIKDKNWRCKAFLHISKELASSLYGNLCTESEAESLILGKNMLK